MNRFQRWVLLLAGYFLLWPTMVALMDFRSLAAGGDWVFMTIMWATMAVALLPLLPFTIDAPVGSGRRLRLVVPYACVVLGCLPWAWFWFFYPYPWLIAGAHCGFAVLVHKALYSRACAAV